jgi:hypothetical protein
MTTVQLDKATTDMLAEYAKQIQDASAARLAILNHFIRQQGLKGNWSLGPDGQSISQPDEADQQPNIAQKNPRKRK